MIQGSQEWIDARLGVVTASRFADVMTKARSGSGLSKTAESYLIDLLGEHLTRQPASELKTFAMEWGQRWEPVARTAYETHADIEVQEVGFVTHPTERLIGCSPDGLVGDDGAIEIKCPLTAANHVRVLRDGVPDDHTEQIQGVLWVTGRQWLDFVSYHDCFPKELRLFVLRVERDEEFIAEMSQRVIAFRDELLKSLALLVEAWKERQVAA